MSPSESPADALLVHDRALRGLARGLLADAHAAEDLAQEAWLAALRRGAGPERPGAWLGTVARNLAAKLRRDDQRRAQRERDSARMEREPSAGEILEREAARARVVAAVLALEEPYRGTVLLRYFENLPPRAIARRHVVPVETVRTRLKRALESLRARLDGEFGARRAWALLLVPLARAPLGAPLLKSLHPTLTLTLMSTQAKLIGGAAVALLALVWLARRSEAPSAPPEPHVVPSAGAQLQEPAREPPSAETPAPAPSERTEAPATEPEPALAVAELGALLVHVTWSDGTPAQGVQARVEPRWSSGNPSWRALEAVTDAAGSFRLEQLLPGRAYVSLDRSDPGWIDIEAGELATLEHQIERGFDVSAIVLDPLGEPVGGAELWLAYAHTDEDGLVVGQAGADGRFFLRSCGSGAIAARAPGFAPSLLQELRANEGGTLELELVLMGPGGALTGRVLDPGGEPVPRACVAVEPPTFQRYYEAVPVGGTRRVKGLTPPVETARTDEAGGFTIVGLEPGVRGVVVRAPGHAPWRGKAEVFEHGSAALDVRLGLGVSVEGRVVDADGRPAQAEVRVEAQPRTLEFLLTTTVSTDSDGRFQLEGLAPGEFEIVAEARRARVRATLRGVPGETLVWEAALARGGTIRGRLVDERGAGLAQHFVEVRDELPFAADACGQTFPGRTDAAGRFAVEGLGDHPHRVEAHPLGEVAFPLAIATGVVPDEEELLLTVELAHRPSVRIAGSVVDASGAPLANAHVGLTNRAYSRGSPGVLSDAEGRFELGPFPPGTWRLEVRAPSGLTLPALSLGPHELGPGETWDCGELVLEAGGELLVRPQPASAEPELIPSLDVLRGTDFVARLKAEAGIFRSGSLAPGCYQLALAGAGVVAALLPFEVRAGETTELAPPLARGLPLSVRVDLDYNRTRQRPVLRITDGHGTLWVEQELLPSRAIGFGLDLGLPAGAYRVEASLPGGRTATAELRLEADGGPREPLVLGLR